MSERECEYHGALTITWDTDDIPDVDGEPRCYVCELEKEKSNLTHVRIPKLEILLGKTVKRADDLQAKLDAAEKQLGTFKKASETYRDGLKDVSEQNEALKSRLGVAEKERDELGINMSKAVKNYEIEVINRKDLQAKIKQLEDPWITINSDDDLPKPGIYLVFSSGKPVVDELKEYAVGGNTKVLMWVMESEVAAYMPIPEK